MVHVACVDITAGYHCFGASLLEAGVMSDCLTLSDTTPVICNASLGRLDFVLEILETG